MRKQVRSCVLIVLAALWAALPGQAQTQPPRIFFTDLESGPSAGGENNNGAILSIYGNFFGSTQGSSTVTVGGGAVAAYKLWSNTRISVAIGPAAASGNIIVTVGGLRSNAMPFAVRPGNIYCVSTSGSDSNPGTFVGGCWATLLKARDATATGDIVYVRNGVAQTGNDGSGWHTSMLIRNGGSAGTPKAMVVYPGESATIGDPTGANDILYGVRTTADSGSNPGYYVLAGFKLRGRVSGIQGGQANNYRVIANEIECPNGDGPDGCVEVSGSNYWSFYGNEVTNVSTNLGSGSGKQYHAVYFTTDSNHIDVGWNHIHDNRTCRALQFHSSPVGGSSGQNQYDLHVHDNLIHGDACDGINFATIDPSKGPVEAYNNVIYDVGIGPSPPDGDANYAGIYFAGTANNGPHGSGTAEVYNNSFYTVGTHPGAYGDNGAIAVNPANGSVRLRNNVFYTSGPYLEHNSGGIVCDTNLWYGNGGSPAACSTNAINKDPLYAGAATGNLSVLAGSPVIDAGLNLGLATDYAGVLRPQGVAYDLGAFEFPGSVTVQKLNPPRNLRVVVQ